MLSPECQTWRAEDTLQNSDLIFAYLPTVHPDSIPVYTVRIVTRRSPVCYILRRMARAWGLGSVMQRREFIAATGNTAGPTAPPSRLARADVVIE
jgi:hypothetical protein